jgi:hypothetical protein
MGFYEMFLN